jgi:putative ABC transport system permease protein
MTPILQDLRYGLRVLAKNPGFTVVALASLALGIGANTFVFSVVDSVLLRPLAYGDSDRLVEVSTRYLPESGQDYPFFALSWPEYRDYRRQTAALEDVAAYQFGASNLAEGRGEPERLPVLRTTANMFDVLRERPLLGRTFARGEDIPGSPCAVVLSHGLWMRRFGGDRGILDHPLRIDGVPCPVIGVMPQGFAFPSPEYALWQVLAPPAGDRLLEDRGSHGLAAVGRLSAGASLEAARAEARAIGSQWARAHPAHHRGHFVVLQSLRDAFVGDSRPALLVLLAAVVLVLVIVCVNLTNLLLVRVEDRRREMAVRAALGAGRPRLLAPLLTESILLSLGGAGIGALVSVALSEAASKTTVLQLPRADEIALSERAWAFHLASALVAGIALGLVPALRFSAKQTLESLRGGRSTTAGASTVRLRGALIVGQIALSVMLVIAAALLLQTDDALRRVRLGFDAQDVLTAQVVLPAGRYAERSRVQEFFRELDARLASVPGVEAAGAISNLPLESWPAPDSFVIEGRRPPAPDEPTISAGFYMITPSALRALRVPILRGRPILETDTEEQPLVALVNEAAVRQHWPGQDPLGQTIHYYGPDETRSIRIVGVVGDTRYRRVQEPPLPAVYVAHAQLPRERYRGHAMSLLLRARDRSAAAVSVRQAVRELDPSVPVAEVQGLDEVVARATGQNRVLSQLISGFAALALLLSVLGIYGIVTYSVRRRTHEMGIRLALGGSPGGIFRGVLAGGARLAGAGVVLGLAAALALGRAVGTQLYGIGAADPATYGGVAAALLLVSLLACAVPARRAAHVDPMTALRSE